MATASLHHADSAARAKEDRAIYRAFSILGKRLKSEPISLSSPDAVKQYLTLAYANEEREIFSALWLDTPNRLIEFEGLFVGTLNETSVYPREVVRAAMRHNAASVIIAHNHPSGKCEPSAADRDLTSRLKQALGLVDCKVLDHVIVAGSKSMSFAERGLI